MFPVMIAYNGTEGTTAGAMADTTALAQGSQLLSEALRQADCQALGVSTLSEAVRLLREQQPAVLIVGQSFDGSNVLDVIPVFRHLQKNLKIILLADDASEGFLRQARAAGIFYHALQPRDAEDVEELQLVLHCAKEASQRKRAGLWQKLVPSFAAG